MKPMLACDAIFDKIKYPCMVMPKIDGVRALNLDGKLSGRSLKPFGNTHTQRTFSYPEFLGLDGELIDSQYGATHPELCRRTTSALGRYDGEPQMLWLLFDYIAPEVRGMPYKQRYALLQRIVPTFRNSPDRRVRFAADRMMVISAQIAYDREQLLAWEEQWLAEGYEGVIVRDPRGYHKSGRATVNEGTYLRIKRFVEEDAVVLSITEGQTNGNDAQINELGQTFRTTHKANMMPNGMVGSLQCRDVKTGEVITVAAGRLDHEQRVMYFNNPDLLLGKTIKYRKFMHGQKDKPRFPTFQSVRIEADIVAE